MTQVRTDPQKIYRTMRQVTILLDRELAEEKQQEAWEQQLRKEEKEAAADPQLASEEVLLFSDLLEALRSGDGSYALENLAQVEYYLHRRGIEAVNYSPDVQDWFDFMPSMAEGTLRPALVKDGKLLRRGLVSGGM